jgi:hypothetical protein
MKCHSIYKTIYKTINKIQSIKFNLWNAKTTPSRGVVAMQRSRKNSQNIFMSCGTIGSNRTTHRTNVYVIYSVNTVSPHSRNTTVLHLLYFLYARGIALHVSSLEGSFPLLLAIAPSGPTPWWPLWPFWVGIPS